tara:strand:+ start:4663 stop:4995 length:333 start_codon:yes stop_codon:yes gene_type:complete
MKASQIKVEHVSSEARSANDDAITLSICDLADAIADAAGARIPISIALWKRETIAEYLGYTSVVVSRDIIIQPDFPDKIEIGTGRWKATEVIEWSLKKKRSTRSGRKRKA